MARRRTGDLEKLIKATARLPWWAGVALALVSYLLFHAMAGTPPGAGSLTPNDLGQVGVHAGKMLLTTVATFAQFVIPAAFLIGAVSSFVIRRRRSSLVDCMPQAPQVQDVLALSWRDFEMLVGEAFRRQGFDVRETTEGADGGVDLELRKGRELYLVQCKQWRATKVGVTVARELYGVIAARGAAGGFVVTAGRFTPDAETFAAGRNIELIAGAQLAQIIRAVRPTTPNARPQSGKPPAEQSGPFDGAKTVETPPACPLCGEPMTLRVARRGTNTGQRFWGCRAFPNCRGTRPAD